MKHLTLLLLLVALVATVSKVTAQDPAGGADENPANTNANENTNTNANENTNTNANENTNTNANENANNANENANNDGDEDDDDDMDDEDTDGDDGTPGDDSTTNSTDSTNSTDTTSGGDNENPFESPVTMETPIVEENCTKVFEGCSSDQPLKPAMCKTYDDELQPCLQNDLEADNTTYSCTGEEVTKFQTYCVGSELLRHATEEMVGVNCQKRIAEIAQTKEFEGSVNGEENGLCYFLDENESDFQKPSQSDAAAKCTDTEYKSFHEGVCDSCSMVMASLSLVVAMVTAQLVLSKD